MDHPTQQPVLRQLDAKRSSLPLDRGDKLDRAHRLHPHFMTVRFLWRYVERVTGQNGGIHAEICGSISKGYAVTIGKPPIRDDQPIVARSKPVLGLCQRCNKKAQA